MAARAKGAPGTRGVGGAPSARVLLAASASTVLTAVVSLPLAYQAHEARDTGSSTTVPTSAPPPSVLGTSTLPTSTSTSATEAPSTTVDSSASTSSTTAAPGGSSSTTAPRRSGTDGAGAGGSGGNGSGTTTSSTPWFVDPAPPTTAGSPSTTTPTVPTTSTSPTTTPPVVAGGLYVSVVADLLRPLPLLDSVLAQPSFVYLELPRLARVEFFLDGEHTATEVFAPFELYGGLPLLPVLLAPGPHVVRAEATFTDGTTTVREATFGTLLPG